MKRLRFYDSTNHRAWLFSSTDKDIQLECLAGLQWTLFLSLKNPSFSNAWLADAPSLCCHLSGSIKLFVVDSPYFKILPILTSLSETTDADKLRMNLIQHRDEQVQRLEKLASKNLAFTTYASWEYYAMMAPAFIATEVVHAFRHPESHVRRLVLHQVKKAHSEIADVILLAQLAQFFLDELPVLITVYYSDIAHIVDVYPKKQAPFFWALETGMLSSELPRTYKFIKKSKPHVFCNSI